MCLTRLPQKPDNCVILPNINTNIARIENKLKTNMMKSRSFASLLPLASLIICSAFNFVPCHSYYSESIDAHHLKEKVTYLHFYYFDIHKGQNPSAVAVARANGSTTPHAAPFGTVYAIDNTLREGPEQTSKDIGNARGLYVSAGRGDLVTMVMYVDYEFTSGKFKGSSFCVVSRNPVTEPVREMAVVGGRGKFRMVRGFAEIRTYKTTNVTAGNGVVEYRVTLFHRHHRHAHGF